MRGTTLRKLRQGATITIPPEQEHRQRVYCIYYQPNHPICRKVYVHNNCRCNEIISLRNRVLFACDYPTPEALNEARKIARAIADWLPKEDKQDGDWIAAYTGRKKRKYLEAEASLCVDPIRRSDSYISAFIKAEKIFELKDPRMIQARTARYNYCLANYLKPIEHHLYNIKGTRRLRHLLPPGRLIAKGLNMQRRARLIQSKMERFVDTVVVSLDASRFDAHVTNMLQVEHLIYQRYWRSPELQRLLAWQVNNKGRTSTGVRYTVKYGRMSGDMNTALGNCLISIIVLAAIMRRLHLRPHQWDMLCDGDDVLLFLPRAHAGVLPILPQQYLDFGFPIKVENIATNLAQVRFCQGFPIRTLHGPTMVSDPTRVLSRALVGVKHWNEPKYIPHYLALIGYCELALNSGVPILQEFALTVLSWGDRLPRKVQLSGRTIKALREERAHPIKPDIITDTARCDLEMATGITAVEQRAIEGALRAVARHRDASEAETKTTDLPPKRWGPWWAIAAAWEHAPPKARTLASRIA
uniref:RNA-directed RNA polymerase n=1 Tax=Riboviria sp. TaxID=2585031 RepID=A0A6M9Z875_9VIRU|nr:MAG: hypothetical protein [Riboviria sp.]